MTIEAAIFCLALNVYHEARGEPLEGQKAVAAVTMTRAGQDPARVCQEVFRDRQFSWTNKMEPGHIFEVQEREPHAWRRANQVARKVVEGNYSPRLKGATHYHAKRVKPKWSKGGQVVAVIGDHIFYKGIAY